MDVSYMYVEISRFLIRLIVTSTDDKHGDKETARQTDNINSKNTGKDN